MTASLAWNLSLYLMLRQPALVFILLVLSQSALALELFSRKPESTLILETENKALSEYLLTSVREHTTIEDDDSAIRRVKEEKKILEKALRARGYYRAKLQYLITLNEKNENRVEHRIDAGPRYRIAEIRYRFPKHIEPPEQAVHQLKLGQPLLAQDVLDAKDRIDDYLKSNHCMFERRLSHQAVLRDDEAEASVVFRLEDSPHTEFGSVSLEGLESVKSDYVLNKIKLKQGDCFDALQLDQTRLTLLQTNLLASADYHVSLRDHPNKADAKVADIRFELRERLHRSIKAGVNYSTDAGPGAKLGWRHRNLFGRAELLDLDTGFNDINKQASAKLVLPRFWSDKQSLNIQSRFEEETPEAFKSTKLHSSAIIARRFGQHTTGEFGAAVTHSAVTEDGEEERFNLLSFPFGLTYDYRDNLLDARRGWMVNTSLSPFSDFSKEDVRFLRWTATGSAFFGSSDWPLQPVLALRASAGSLTGTALENVPADERFYVGGGGSVRGYAYQTLGELSDGKADGGLSFAETSIELRGIIRGNWGFALFVDGGYAYATKLPGFGEDFRWGAGAGLRYHTSFAPIRVDFGVPLDKRDGIDDSFQLYVSIGQAF